MKDSTLLRIALATAAIGMIALYFLSLSEELSGLHELPARDAGDTVTVKGTVTGVRDMGTATLVEVSAYEKVPVVVFDTYKAVIGSEVTVRGELELYKGRYEIIADSIE